MRISVIIPLYNKADYVKRALESVRAQTFTDWECIIVNDGSTDNSPEIVASWLASNPSISSADSSKCNSIKQVPCPSIRLVHQENAGVSAARNHGISLSTGEYVCFLDADDWWAPTFLEEMVRCASEYPEAGLYASNYWYYKLGKTHVAVRKVYGVECKEYEEEGWGGYMNYPRTYCEGEMPIWTGAVMIPRRVLDDLVNRSTFNVQRYEWFPLGITLGEDFLLWSRIALRYKVAFLNKPLAYYNNDIPASLRLTRHLHAPETHMLWHLGEIENRTQNIEDWKRLLDKLRVKGLQKYWLSDTYHEMAKVELQKVDWNLQCDSVKRWYKNPKWILQIVVYIMRVGCIIKNVVLRWNKR